MYVCNLDISVICVLNDSNMHNGTDLSILIYKIDKINKTLSRLDIYFLLLNLVPHCSTKDIETDFINQSNQRVDCICISNKKESNNVIVIALKVFETFLVTRIFFYCFNNG